MDSFTKFDHLGDALRAAGVGTSCVGLNWQRSSEGEEHFSVYLHSDDKAFSGFGDTPSAALAAAIAKQDAHDAAKKIAAVESACEMERAA